MTALNKKVKPEKNRGFNGKIQLILLFVVEIIVNVSEQLLNF